MAAVQAAGSDGSREPVGHDSTSENGGQGQNTKVRPAGSEPLAAKAVQDAQEERPPLHGAPKLASYASILAKRTPNDAAIKKESAENSGPQPQQQQPAGSRGHRRMSEGSGPSVDQARPAVAPGSEDVASSHSGSSSASAASPKLRRTASQPSTHRALDAMAPEKRPPGSRGRASEDSGPHSQQFNRGKTSIDDAAARDVGRDAAPGNGDAPSPSTAAPAQQQPAKSSRQEAASYAGLFQPDQRRQARSSFDSAMIGGRGGASPPGAGSGAGGLPSPSSRELQEVLGREVDPSAVNAANYPISGRRCAAGTMFYSYSWVITS